MRSQLVGMTGVYYAAAELSRRGFVVSVTSRNARGADLLATDQEFLATWLFQVKTNADKSGSWRLGQGKVVTHPNCFYIFVNLNGERLPEYWIAEGTLVAAKKRPGSSPYINRADLPKVNGWQFFESVAYRDLTWDDARTIAKKPGDYPTALLSKALLVLKPPKNNKLDRDYRKAIVEALSSRTRSPAVAV